MLIKQHKKAQVAVLDLYISALMFGILITFVMFTWNNYNIKINNQLDYNSDLIKAYHISDLFVKYQGKPTAWHRTNITENPISILGLAQSEGVLNSDKVDIFINDLN